MSEGLVAYIHWNEEENIENTVILKESGFDILQLWQTNNEFTRDLRAHPPDCIVIDLRRIPSQGRALGIWFRQQKSTRQVPLVFIRGDKGKTRRVENLLPDALFTDWKHVINTVKRSMEQKPMDPVVPGTMDSYSGTPLPRKLGLRSNSTVLLVHAPADFEQYLTPVPDTVSVTRDDYMTGDIVLLFTRSNADLIQSFPSMSERLMDGGKLWIIWPKKASGLPCDLTQQTVRSFGLERGYVDYKVASIDETWSGLCFARRKRAYKSKSAKRNV
jgi:hypothetical protein